VTISHFISVIVIYLFIYCLFCDKDLVTSSNFITSSFRYTLLVADRVERIQIKNSWFNLRY